MLENNTAVRVFLLFFVFFVSGRRFVVRRTDFDGSRFVQSQVLRHLQRCELLIVELLVIVETEDRAQQFQVAFGDDDRTYVLSTTLMCGSAYSFWA